MITMELLGKIRRMHVRDKISERAIAKRTGLSRNTVHKWLQTPEQVTAPKYVRAKGFSKLGDFVLELELQGHEGLDVFASAGPPGPDEVGDAAVAAHVAAGFDLQIQRFAAAPVLFVAARISF